MTNYDNYNWDDEQSNFELIPEKTVLNVTIIEAKRTFSQEKFPQIFIKTAVVDGPYEKRHVSDFFSFRNDKITNPDPSQLPFNLKRSLALIRASNLVIGGVDLQNDGMVDHACEEWAMQLVGKCLTIETKNDADKNDKTKIYTKIGWPHLYGWTKTASAMTAGQIRSRQSVAAPVPVQGPMEVPMDVEEDESHFMDD